MGSAGSLERVNGDAVWRGPVFVCAPKALLQDILGYELEQLFVLCANDLHLGAHAFLKKHLNQVVQAGKAEGRVDNERAKQALGIVILCVFCLTEHVRV